MLAIFSISHNFTIKRAHKTLRSVLQFLRKAAVKSNICGHNNHKKTPAKSWRDCFIFSWQGSSLHGSLINLRLGIKGHCTRIQTEPAGKTSETKKSKHVLSHQYHEVEALKMKSSQYDKGFRISFSASAAATYIKLL